MTDPKELITIDRMAQRLVELVRQHIPGVVSVEITPGPRVKVVFPDPTAPDRMAHFIVDPTNAYRAYVNHQHPTVDSALMVLVGGMIDDLKHNINLTWEQARPRFRVQLETARRAAMITENGRVQSFPMRPWHNLFLRPVTDGEDTVIAVSDLHIADWGTTETEVFGIGMVNFRSFVEHGMQRYRPAPGILIFDEPAYGATVAVFPDLIRSLLGSPENIAVALPVRDVLVACNVDLVPPDVFVELALRPIKSRRSHPLLGTDGYFRLTRDGYTYHSFTPAGMPEAN